MDNKMSPHWRCEKHDLVLPNVARCPGCEQENYSTESFEERKRILSGKIHTGYPDCCADCELQFAMKLSESPAVAKSKKRTWFISYAWRSYSVAMEERKTGFGNVYHHDFRGLNITAEDIALLERNMAMHHRPFGGNPADVCEVVVLNIVEIGAI
jgi:hypothetical protein